LFSYSSCRYGYVSFATKEAADLAISTFDDQLQLQGSGSSLSVYYAKKQHDSHAAPVQDKESCPARNAKLYFCGTPSSFRRDSILALFSAFGRVRHLQVYTDSFGVLASGTVTMYSTEEATAAMNSLDGKVLQPGTAPLKVGALLGWDWGHSTQLLLGAAVTAAAGGASCGAVGLRTAS
jgi:RNA recognition motif-containing protein